MATWTTRKTPVLHAVLWDGEIDTIADMPDIEYLLEDHIHYRNGVLTFFPGTIHAMTLVPDADYLVRGVPGNFFVMPRQQFEHIYRPVEVNQHGSVVHRIRVERQPRFPDDVRDYEVRTEFPKAPWIFYIISQGHGVAHWSANLRHNGMPAQMVEESMPDAVEYWRECCPHWNEDVLVDLVETDSELSCRVRARKPIPAPYSLRYIVRH